MAKVRAEKSKSQVEISVIRAAATSLGYNALKTEQEQAMEAFSRGKDVFVSLPTGYGKSLCYTLIPRIFDMLRSEDKASIAIIISPLISLMQDQATIFNQKGISSICVSHKDHATSESRRNIFKGKYQLVFISPEPLFGSLEWRRMLSTDIFMKNLHGRSSVLTQHRAPEPPQRPVALCQAIASYYTVAGSTCRAGIIINAQGSALVLY